MQEPSQVLGEGTRVVTNGQLGSVAGLIIKEHHLRARRPNAVGTVKGFVPGHGGDVYWILHDGETIAAAYCWNEFEFFQDKK